ncbi:hypothetical protein SASPL_123893 [Salvia splendens]|uniref:Fumarylacetoacetase n=1 Tax=Salvia splendens TaxID=180675 RepID=A0A8X8XR56_SALSN|nr:hypothetical protein SASPL_123893 [Salvia splendens]
MAGAAEAINDGSGELVPVAAFVDEEHRTRAGRSQVYDREKKPIRIGQPITFHSRVVTVSPLLSSHSRQHRFTPHLLEMVLKSFIEVHPDSHFPIQNLPYGVFKREPASDPRPAVAIGEYVLDLSVLASAGLFHGSLLRNSDCFNQVSFAPHFFLISTNSWNWGVLRGRKLVQHCKSYCQSQVPYVLAAEESILRDNASLREKALVPMNQVQMLLPITIGDYSDFFASKHHAYNCGVMFRGPENAINPNWFHIPIAYHGRASSIVISGTDIIRPRGQGHPAGNSLPYFGPSRKLDFELEMATVVGPGNELGKPVDVNEAANHIFGLVLMNDWSARDIQAWEYVPLGPFLGKSFATTLSPWIVTLDALEQFALDAPQQNPTPLPYLAEKKSQNYDISLQVSIVPAGQKDAHVLTRSNFRHLYWTITQQLAHQTINGCNLRPGDLLGTGTISGPEPDSYGCLLELSWNGQKPLSFGGTSRTFLEDGDEVIFTGYCKVKVMVIMLALEHAPGRFFLRYLKNCFSFRLSLLQIVLDCSVKLPPPAATVSFLPPPPPPQLLFIVIRMTALSLAPKLPESLSPPPSPLRNLSRLLFTSLLIPNPPPLLRYRRPSDLTWSALSSGRSPPSIRKPITGRNSSNARHDLRFSILPIAIIYAESLQILDRVETVDAVRSSALEKMKINEALMRLLFRLDAVPGLDPNVRELRRDVSRKIVGLQEILDAVSDSRVEQWDGHLRDWDDIVAGLEQEACKDVGGGHEMERFCAENLGFQCLQRFLRDQ